MRRCRETDLPAYCPTTELGGAASFAKGSGLPEDPGTLRSGNARSWANRVARLVSNVANPPVLVSLVVMLIAFPQTLVGALLGLVVFFAAAFLIPNAWR